MNESIVEIMFPWNGKEHPTQRLRFARIPCVGEYIAIADDTPWLVDSVIHYAFGGTIAAPKVHAQVRVR